MYFVWDKQFFIALNRNLKRNDKTLKAFFSRDAFSTVKHLTSSFFQKHLR